VRTRPAETPDPEVWLESRWPETRRFLVSLIVEAALDLPAVLAEVPGDLPEEDAEAFRDRVLAACRTATGQGGRRAEMAAAALPILAHFRHVSGALRAAASDLAPAIRRGRERGLIARVVRQALERARREAAPGDPKERARWERLDRISRALAAEDPSRAGGRCDPAHFEALAAHIRRAYPDDRNLPRRVETIAGYFFRWCPDCRDSLEDPAVLARADGQIGAAEAALLPGAATLADALWDCVGELPPHLAPLVERLWPEDERVAPLSVGAIKAGLGLSQRGFYARRAAALAALRACLDGKDVLP